jgi:CheY-like chemotaxis protein
MTRVLVAEDDAPVRVLMHHMLTRSGFQVETAVDGEDAIEKLTSEKFDGLVLDLMMPRTDGFGVLQHLVKNNPNMIARTVVATAYPRDAAKAQLTEVCRVIIKPFDATQLVEAVRECVGAGKPAATLSR